VAELAELLQAVDKIVRALATAAITSCERLHEKGLRRRAAKKAVKRYRT
jgi:hypothetical protein